MADEFPEASFNVVRSEERQELVPAPARDSRTDSESDPDLTNGGAGIGESMTGTVRWFKNEKGYGRIEGDDDYLYFVHFAGIEMDRYKTLVEGQRVAFQWLGSYGAHGRKAVERVRALV